MLCSHHPQINPLRIPLPIFWPCNSSCGCASWAAALLCIFSVNNGKPSLFCAAPVQLRQQNTVATRRSCKASAGRRLIVAAMVVVCCCSPLTLSSSTRRRRLALRIARPTFFHSSPSRLNTHDARQPPPPPLLSTLCWQWRRQHEMRKARRCLWERTAEWCAMVAMALRWFKNHWHASTH